MTWEEADEMCDDICETIDDMDEDTLDRGDEFFENVRERVVGIQETITRSQHVTERQESSLRNMLRGVRKWVHDD
jgi:hypothetical protein